MAQQWDGPLQTRTGDEHAYGIDGDAVVLVRPDRHVARTALDAGPALEYLTGLGRTTA